MQLENMLPTKPRKNVLLILADDLTGALDSGVQFGKNGIDVLVYPSFEAAILPSGNHHAQGSAVLVINANTRHSTPEEARSRVKAIVKAFGNYAFFYKKTDSCLRGNIGAELEALMEATKSPRLPFVPAFPDLKRITRKGFQYLDGKLIHLSSMARDPLNPITESYIPSIIGKQSAIPVSVIKRNSAIPEPQNYREILVFDGKKFKDLRKTARLLWDRELLRTSAGCAGFAETLMETVPFEKSTGRNHFKPLEKFPILVVSGSLHRVSIGQAVKAQKKKVPGFGLPGERILQPGWLDSIETETLAVECSQGLLENGIAILGTEASLGMTWAIAQGNAQDISEALGEMVRKIIEKTGPLHLAIFGGDTLLAIMKTLKYNCIRPLEEIRPGVVLAKAEGQTSKGLLVTKSGAFGELKLISVIYNYFMYGE